VTRNCGEVIESKGLEIFILPLPAKQGAKYVKQCYAKEVEAKLMGFLKRKVALL
jgi:hypothetical protein